MRHLVILLLLLSAFCNNAISQNSEDCVDAQELVPDGIPISLSNLPDITIDSVIGAGVEPAEWFVDNEDQCGFERTFSANPEDKSHWFVFSAETSGSMELLITPEAPGTTYDFALWKGACPNEQTCSELFYCNWGGNVNCGTYVPTGASPDPIASFNYDPVADNNAFVYAESIQLDAGENYYLLVQNTDEASNFFCPSDSDSLGFTIQFDGDAMINTKIVHQPPTALTPLPQADTLKLCRNESMTFAVTPVPNASNYDWISKSSVPDINVTPNALGDSATVQFNGEGVGQICMEIICPIQSLICWDVQVDQIPDLEALPFPNVSCDPVDLNTRFRDNNNVVSPVAFYETAADATNETNPLTDEIVTLGGNYWARKNTPNNCFDIVQMDVQVNYIQVSLVDTFRFCPQAVGRNFVDLQDDIVPIISVNNAQSNDIYRFYEDSLAAINNGAPVGGGGTVFQDGEYWVKIERQGQNAGDCFGLTSFEIIIDAAPEIAPIGDQEFCGNNCFQLADLDLFQPDGQPLNTSRSFYNDSLAADVGDISTTIQSLDICTSGTYWVRAESSASCYDVAPFKLTFFPAPNIINDTLDIDCTAGCIDLSNYGTDRNGLDPSILQTQYFDNQADAEDLAATPLADIVFCDPTQVWMRMTNTDNGCFDVAQITIQGMPLPTATLSDPQTICAGETVSVEVTLTGDAPFQLSYSDGVQIFDETVPTNIFRTAVSPDSTATYRLISMMDSNGCTGVANDTTLITVNNGPTIGGNISGNCTPSALEYQISFDIIGNDTYTVTGISGNQSGNSFESDFIPSGNEYSFTISGTNGCADYVQLPTPFFCECNSVVGLMDLQARTYCQREPAIANYLGSGFALEKDDSLIYILHEGADTILVNPIVISGDPVFVFDDATMTAGVTYYMSAVVTKLDNTGQLIIDETRNPCMDVAQGQPVTFVPIPTVELTVSTDTICVGEAIDLTFNIEGVGPYDVIYFDGAQQVLLTDIDSGHVETIMPDADAQIYVEFINPKSISDCENMFAPFDNPLDITVYTAPVIENITEHCNAEGSRLILTFDVTGGDPASYMVSGLTGSFKGNEFISDSLAHGTPYTLSVSDDNGCPSAIINDIAECFCTPDISVSITTVKEVSCAGEQDAILMASPQNGMAPFTYFWSTGETTETINSLAPAVPYSVTMTDANGCELMDTLTLATPTSIVATTNRLDPSCYGTNDGVILIVQTEGGTGDYSYSFNGGSFQADAIKDNFPAGVYSVAVRDENDCEWREEVTLQDPPEFDVNLGGSIALNLGDSLTLEPLVNQDDGMLSYLWESSDTSLCVDCINPIVKPSTSGRYKVTVMNGGGCSDSAEILVQVQNQRRIFIPSVFSPNGDGNNDLLRPFSGSEVEEIAMFRIYNRWGELIYEKEDMDMNSGLDGWDGITKSGRKAPPGVYLYYTEISWSNGTKDILTGDISLVR